MIHKRTSVKITDVVHSRIAGGANLFCAWPWTGGIHNFGNGEIVIAYTERPCTYQTTKDIEHSEHNARLVLCRTLDGGQTWPEELRQVVRDNREPFEEWISQGGEPQSVDMTGEDAMFLFWRWRMADWSQPGRVVTFALRSTDRGYHWHMPPVIVPPHSMHSIWGSTNYLKQPDGAILAGIGGYRYGPGIGERFGGDELAWGVGRAVLYISKDQGLHWYCLSTIAYEFDGMDTGYPALLRLPHGRLLCTVGFRASGSPCWTSVTCSDDGGRTWAEPRRINDLGDQANLCRLSDGRIVCVYGYRFVPYGIRGVVSEDDGQTWSDEFVIRSDGAGLDLGYPVVTELPDGRILTVYYFNQADDDINYQILGGGRRFIAASTFRLT